MPAKGSIWYFHPLEFLEHLEHVTEINVRALIASAAIPKGNSHIVKYKGAMVIFSTDRFSYPAIKDALDRPQYKALDQNWEKTDKRKNFAHSSGKSYAENMEYTLKQIFKMAGDPEIQKLIGNMFIVGSTFREKDPLIKNGDAGHCEALAFDFNSIVAWYYANGVPNKDFSPVKSLACFEIMAEKYGVKQILFNCPYIIANAKKAYVNCQYYPHHDHAHIDFFHNYSRKDITGKFITKYNCKYDNYECPHYNGCEYSLQGPKGKLEHDSCVKKPGYEPPSW